MANKGLIGVQMSTIAPAKMPHFDAYESMGKLADIGYHCVEISQVPMTAENVAVFHLSHAARYARRVPVQSRRL